MEDIIRAKLKATVEAMLFVSTQPVPIQKILKKVRQVAKKEREKCEALQLQLTEVLQVPAETGEDGDDDIQFVTAPAISAEEENIEIISLENEMIEEDDAAAVEELTEDDEGDSAVEQMEEEELSEFGVSDIKEQLLKKQQELSIEITTSDVKSLLKEIQEELQEKDHGIELIAVAKGYQFRTKYDISLYLNDEKVQAPSRFSPPSLETLAIIAYQQPVTRQKIEEIRGVDSGGVMKTLLDKGMIRLIGRSEEPGRPLVYGTTKTFLEIFGLNQLKDLPTLNDYQSLQLSRTTEDGCDDEAVPTTAEPNYDIVIDDLLDDEMDHLSLEDEAILGDLNETLKNLKQVEKEVMASHVTEQESEAHDPEEQQTDQEGVITQ